MPHHAAIGTSFSKFSGFVNLNRNIICIFDWKLKQTLKLYTNVKLERESDYHYLADAIVEGKSTVESAVSLATTERSNFQVPELTPEQTDKIPDFGI